MRKINDVELVQTVEEAKAEIAREDYMDRKGITQKVQTPDEARAEMIRRQQEAHKK